MSNVDPARDAAFAGPWRAPVNIAADAQGSIHDDKTARELGLRGGTVAGSIHMEQFPPLLVRLFGEAWLKRGGLSLYFKHATTNGERVRCCASVPTRDGAAGRARVWMEAEAGQLVCEGTASVGAPDPASALRQRLASATPPKELRILKHLHAGATVSGCPARIASTALDRHLKVITEPMPGYADAVVFGGRALPANLAIDALRACEATLTPLTAPSVGLYGAIELNMLDGPIFADRDYLVRGRIVAFGETPQTEVIWTESVISHGERDVASLLLMSRLMKASSPLWAGS